MSPPSTVVLCESEPCVLSPAGAVTWKAWLPLYGMMESTAAVAVCPASVVPLTDAVHGPSLLLSAIDPASV